MVNVELRLEGIALSKPTSVPNGQARLAVKSTLVLTDERRMAIQSRNRLPNP